MTIIPMSQYMANKIAFYRTHAGEIGYRETSSLNKDTIHKTVTFPDGAIWYETTRPVFEEVVTKIHGLTITTKVKLYRTEFWDTETPLSRFFFERA